jgi:hypothetical protein
MAAVTLNIYDNFRLGQWLGTSAIDFAADTIKCALVASTYTPNQNTHEDFADITNEVTGTNYVAGGAAMATPTVTMDGAGLVTIDSADPATWSQSASGFSTARRAIVYQDTGVAATSRLIGYSDAFTADKGNVDGDFDVTVNASGIATQAQ